MGTKKLSNKKQPDTQVRTNVTSIIISILAVIISTLSFWWSREQFIKSSRPYVWACNYQTLVPGTNTAIAIPSIIVLRVHNSPARIIQLDLYIHLNEKEFYYYHLKNSIRYPDDKVEWKLEIIKEDFDKLFVNIPDSLMNKVHRTVSIKYSSINGGRTYYYNLEQYFWSEINQWEAITEDGN